MTGDEYLDTHGRTPSADGLVDIDREHEPTKSLCSSARRTAGNLLEVKKYTSQIARDWAKRRSRFMPCRLRARVPNACMERRAGR